MASRSFSEQQLREAMKRVIVALDVILIDRQAMAQIVAQIGARIGGYAVGPAFAYTSELPYIGSLFQAFNREHRPFVMCDARLYETPHVAAQVATLAARQGYRFMTIAVEAGWSAMHDAERATREFSRSFQLVAVGVLPGHDERTLEYVGVKLEQGKSVQDLRWQRIKDAWAAGIRAAVCPTDEVATLKRYFPGIVLIVQDEPTSRPWSNEKYTAGLTRAMRDGADYIVVGPEILDDSQPFQALAWVARAMCEGMFRAPEDDIDDPPTSC